ncbi:Tropomodulin [Operophtera brumata]|uniref:Tropomodulin n=1 Tax=Operophtera brumata TaxID=104452 RepID=A0A0L7LER1_OPEBR|nr:Tropomodulin [Operophtera brumata]
MVEKSSSTKTTTMTTPAKLFGRELSEYDEDNFLPPDQRNNYDCEKNPTGPLNRKKLIEHINKQALETPDRPEDQYHASLLNKGQPVGLGWDGITKASKPKVFPMDPPNDTDPEDTITRVLCLVNVGLNDRTALKLADALTQNSTLRVVNVETNFISPAGVVQLRSQVLGNKIEMEITSLVEQNPTLLRLGLHLEYSDARHRVASHLQRNIDRSEYEMEITSLVEQNPTLLRLGYTSSTATLGTASPAICRGTSIEMEITSLVEQNPTLLRLGLHLEYRDARHRVASHLQRNIDRSEYEMEITSLVGQNPTLLRLGLHLEYSDVRHRVASHLQRNIDRSEYEMEITSLAGQNPTLLRLGLHLECSDARHRVASHLQRNIDRNCRVQKRASASLSLRLRAMRGRPPAVGVDSSFFNLTPPSAEAVTPTNEQPVISENVEQSVTVDVKLPAAPINTEPATDAEKTPEAIVPVLPAEIDTTERVIPVDVEPPAEVVTNGMDTFVRAERPDINPNPHS